MAEEIRNVGKEEPEVEEKKVEEKTEQEKQREKSLAIFSQSDEAIAVADKMLRGFDIKLADEDTRPGLTGPTGVVIGASVNRLLDSAVETDPDKKAQYREIGLTSLAEITVAGMKTLFAGNRKRIAEGKNIVKPRR